MSNEFGEGDINQKLSSFDSIVAQGFSEDDKKELLQSIGPYKMEQGGKLVEGELEKSSEQIEVCRLINDLTNEIRKEYGLETFDIPVENIHVFPLNLYFGDGSEVGGIFYPENQNVIVRQGGSLLEFADYVCHELIHFKSHGALQVTTEGEIDFQYRSGFKSASRDGKKSYFRHIDEGLTEMISKQLIEKLKAENHTLFKRDIEETERVKQEYRDNKEVTEFFASGDILSAHFLPENDPNRLMGFNIKYIPYAYKGQRDCIGELMDKIYKKNSDQFTDTDEIYRLFVKGKLEGNYLSIGRIIDQTYGKGTFRKLGEVSSAELPDFENFVHELR